MAILQLRQLLKKKRAVLIPAGIGALVVLVLVLAIFVFGGADNAPKTEVISQAALEEIVHTSNLSTFEAIYNGIATVYGEDDPEKADYHVSYEATVKAGFDFSQIAIGIDSEEKWVTVTLPQISITAVNVDITSLDYMFVNDKANTETVSQEAYKACISDAETESRDHAAIFTLARQNAENVVTALLKPFVTQLDEDYTIEIRWEDGK